jgi:ATP-dependent DNA helicase RecG
LYGDLDVSIINELPPGRGRVETRYFPQEQSGEVYGLVADLVKEGRQAFIVYPLVEESEKLDLKAAEESFKHFEKHEFKNFRLGLIHGRMNRSQTELIMNQFQNKEIDILVATTVVEVGVDVPNASVMVIEHAERFGLSQLHQLRGRIGRGEADALCFLISDPATDEAKARVEAILSTNDGFKIAEADLMIRGPGEFFGRHQHGLNELKVANPATQLDILELARQEAMALTAGDPQLRLGANMTIKEVVRKRYPAYLAMVSAG